MMTEDDVTRPLKIKTIKLPLFTFKIRKLLGRIAPGANKRIQAEINLLQLTEQLKAEISERKLIQQDLFIKQTQLENINQTLTERIDDAVEKLRHNDQIMIARDRQAAMGEMIGNIAHQWRQPLNSLGLIIQYLQRTCHSDKMKDDELFNEFAGALAIIMHMSSTIDDFRNFFAPNNTKQNFSISESISNMLAFISDHFNQSRIQLVIKAEENLSAFGYPNEYCQVLLNIVNNARDQLLEQNIASPCITISSFTQDGRSITTIHDNGGGIPEDIIERVFAPYFTTKQQGKGTGIGLYMCKNIIETHMDGHITVSNIAGGAEFRIEV